MSSIILQSDVNLFLGRFHPLAVHLPIGFILLGCLFYFLSKVERFVFLKNALPLIFFLSAISSVVAVVMGLFLATQGGYDENELFWHRWLGISTMIISIVAWLWSIGFPGSGHLEKLWKFEFSASDYDPRLVSFSMLILLLLISLTGHLGGTLTHGNGYLTAYAPQFVKNFTGEDESSQVTDFPEESDSIYIYTHFIQPILEQKCVSCHNESKKKGNLILVSYEDLLEGGDNGDVIVSGSAIQSEIFKRVVMDPSSRKFMPPKGTHMSFNEVKLLEYWINDGISLERSIVDAQIPDDIKTIIEDQYHLTTKLKSFVEKLEVDSVSMEIISRIQAAGFSIRPLATNSNVYDVKVIDSTGIENLNALIEMQNNIAWLDLSNSRAQDDDLETLSGLENLIRLQLQNNSITDSGLIHLGNLQHLESLNLFSTEITDNGLESLAKFPSLKSVYLWDSKVTAEGADYIKSERPDIEINIGFDLIEKDSIDSD